MIIHGSLRALVLLALTPVYVSHARKLLSAQITGNSSKLSQRIAFLGRSFNHGARPRTHLRAKLCHEEACVRWCRWHVEGILVHARIASNLPTPANLKN